MYRESVKDPQDYFEMTTDVCACVKIWSIVAELSVSTYQFKM